MTRAWKTGMLLLALLTATAMAQAPDMEPGREDGDGPRNGRGPRGPRGLLGLLAPADAEVAVENVAHGVELKVTARDPDKAGQVQEQVEEAADDVRQMAERLARWQERRPNAPLPPGLPGMLVEGKLTLSVVRVEGGSVVQVLAQDEQQARDIQQNMAEWVEKARERRERLANYYRRAAVVAELRRMVDEGTVQMEFENTADGVRVRFLSDDAAMARKLQRVLPDYFRSLINRTHETPRPGRRNRDRDDED